MKIAPLTIMIFLVVLSGCSTHASKVEYEGAGIDPSQVEPTVTEIIVSDERRTDSDWLGAIRGGYGNVLKTLRTEESTDAVVDKIYTAALNKSGIMSNTDDAPYSLRVAISKFDCSYYFNREAHAHVDVSLIVNDSSKIKFSKSYKSDLVESGVGAGIFGDVDTLRDLAEKAMNETVDKMLQDPEFIAALLPEKDATPAADSAAYSKRLTQLESLRKEGLISESEYQEKRETIVSEL